MPIFGLGFEFGFAIQGEKEEGGKRSNTLFLTKKIDQI
jgi:hypothetical protein